MNIEEKISGTTACFELTGSLSGTEKSTIHLFDQISIAMDREKLKNVILNLEKVTYIDSMSIGIIVGILLKGKEKDITFRLQNLTKQVRGVFESSNLIKIFPDLY